MITYQDLYTLSKAMDIKMYMYIFSNYKKYVFVMEFIWVVRVLTTPTCNDGLLLSLKAT